MKSILFVAFVLLESSLLPGQCSTAACLGSTTADPLTITGTHAIGAGAVLDFGPRHVILGANAHLWLDGDATFLAARLTLQVNSTIQPPGLPSNIFITVAAAGGHDGSVVSHGAIHTNGGTAVVTASSSVSIVGGVGASSFGSVDCTDYAGSVHVTAGGDVSVSGWIAAIGSHAGTITVTSAAGPVTVSGTLTAEADPACGWNALPSTSGTVTVSAATTAHLTATGVIDVGAGDYGGGGTINVGGADVIIDGYLDVTCHYLGIDGHTFITASDSVAVNGLVDSSGGPDTQSWPTFDIVAGGDCTVSGDVYCSGSNPGWAGVVTISCGGACTISGDIDASTGSPEENAAIHVTAAGPVDVSGALFAETRGGSIRLTSTGSDVAFSGSASTQLGLLDENGGGVEFTAAGNLTIGGSVYGAGLPITNAVDLVHRFTAGRSLTFLSTASVGNFVGQNTANCIQPTGRIVVDACRVVVQGGAQLSAAGPSCGGVIEVTAGDTLDVAGVLDATGTIGAVVLKTRLAAPFAPVVTGSILPAPTVTHDAAMPPCLANGLAVFTAPAIVPLGAVLTYAVNSTPNAPVALLVHHSVVHLPLGVFGWSQVDLFTAARLADDLGVFGPPLPATTDTLGQWSLGLLVPVIPALSGFTLIAEAFVADAAALNGVFHQMPYRATTLN